MKTIPFFLIIAFSSALFLTSCDPDATDDPNPADPREKFLGNWTVQESKKKLTYEVQITASPTNSAEVIINNFYNTGIKPFAVITTSTITCPVQSFPSQQITINGAGTYSSEKINWVYYVNDGADLDTITAVYSR
jgi:hypothetical protein